MSNDVLNAVEDALLALLQAQAANVASPLHVASWGGQVPVDDGSPAELRPEHLWIGEDVDITFNPETTGSVGGTFVGEFHLPIYLYIERTGTDFKTTRTRAAAIITDIESLIMANQSISGTCMDAYIDGSHRAAGQGNLSTGILWTLRLYVRSYP